MKQRPCHAAWVTAKLRQLPKKIPLAPGNCVPLRGELHQIAHCPGERRGIWLDTSGQCRGDLPLICVGAQQALVARRVKRSLVLEAQRDLKAVVLRHTRKLGFSPPRITLRDTTSGWGSCSSADSLNFSWRLILAPSYVLDYLAAHESAHLLHLNHSDSFWATVAYLTADTDRAEAWLKTHGSGLLRFE